MTNDLLSASIAGALIQANLQFTASLGKVGELDLRVFDLDFTLRDGRRISHLSAYVSGVVFVALAPIKIPDQGRRREIAEFLVQRIPMVRLLPSPDVYPDHDIAWVEASVPIPPNPAVEAAPPWLVVPPFMLVVSAIENILEGYAEHASLPETRLPAFLMTTERHSVPVAHEPAA
jgi:hypothetical protein